MDTSVKTEEAQNSSLPRVGDNKPKLFEKIVYFASGSIGNEVSIALYVHGIVNYGVSCCCRHYWRSKTAMPNRRVCCLILLHIVLLEKIM